MEHTSLVSPSELEDFANRRDSESVIPELVYWLVTVSAPDLSLCRIPYGDSIGLPGRDGIVQTESGYSRFVPKQTSYWEIGRSENAQDKATDDYRKRLVSTPLAERKKAVFVFVTPRSWDWPEKSQSNWIRKRQKDGWRDIKIIDGVQLCDWVREFPAVGKLLLQRIGLVRALTGFETPGGHWALLCKPTRDSDPSLPPKLFLTGRDRACTELHRLFRREISQLILKVHSEHDAEDFVAAFLKSLDEETSRTYSGRCLFISDPEAWHAFSSLRASHVLLANPPLDLIELHEHLHRAALAGGHRVIIPVSGAWSNGVEDLIPILTPSQTVIERTLLDSGFSQERANELAGAGAQSFGALKRHLRGLSEVPPYANWDNARLLALAGLIGRWKGDNSVDREAMEILLGKTYGEWIEATRSEALRPDTPLIQRNEAWKVISRGEAWAALGPRLNDEDLTRFQRMALRVLGEKDPRFELPKDQRNTALMFDQGPAHSKYIREGIVETLALLGARHGALTFCSDGKAEATARIVVRKLLQKADWQTWAGLNRELPLLSEAAPVEFLDAVEEALSDPQSSPFREVFGQESGGIGGRNYTTGVLWGLETLAWHPDYLGRVTTLLGDMAAIDPGGNWANRPKNSLVDIFLPWHVQTLADLSERRAALEALLREQPLVAWEVLLDLLPNAHGSTSGTRKPVWRSFIPSGWKEAVTDQQYWTQIQTYGEMCVRIASTQLPKLIQLVERLADLPHPAHSQVLDHLASPAITSLPESDRVTLWEALTDLISKHRRFADANWTMSSDQLSKIEDVARRLAPTSLRLANRRLFTERDFDLYEENQEFDVQQKLLQEKRVRVIKQLLDSDGPESVVRFSREVESARKVGSALGSIEDPIVDSLLLPSLLTSTDRTTNLFIGSFVFQRYWLQKWPWVDFQLKRRWKKDHSLAFLLQLPFEPETWRRAEKALKSDVSNYWRQAQVNPWGLEQGALLEAAENLLNHHRPAAAVDCLYLLAHKKASIPIKLASDVLLGTLAAEELPGGLEHHHLVEVIKWLQENEPTDSEALFRIEWGFLPLLDRIYGGEPKTVERRLASSPNFFCEVVAAVFRSDKDDKAAKRDVTDLEKQIARNAYRLLHGWRILPGQQVDGSFEGKLFLEWLDEVKRISRKSGHFRIAMDQLGQALAYAPKGSDGLWIDKAIAEALDSKDVPEMRRGFAVGLHNTRGVFTFTHGEDEKAISLAYREKAKALADKGFHRAADAVRSVADDYERDSQREAKREMFDD